MIDFLMWLLVILVLGGLAAGGFWYYRTQLAEGDNPGLFRGRAEKRLSISEQASVDGRRKLVLIRRDGVEHLIMTGGPVDVVIETGIKSGRQQAGTGVAVENGEGAVYSRGPRTFGRVDSEPTL